MGRTDWEGYFEAVRDQDWRTAREALTGIAANESTNPLVYLRMGDVCQRLGDTSHAVKAYHVAARIQTLAGFQNKAITLYKIILRIDPENAEAVSKSEELLKEMEGVRHQHVSPEHGIAFPEAPPPPDRIAASGQPVPATGPASELNAGNSAPASSQDFLGEADAVIGGSGIPSMEEIFSSLPEEGFQKMLDDLMIPLSERHQPKAVPPELFDGMSADEIAAILSGLSVTMYHDKDVVIEEGDSGDCMYLIKSGVARVVAHMLGREIELALLGEGDLFGEVAFLTSRTRTASIIAVGPLEAYEMDRMHIEQLLDRNPELMSRLEGFYENRIKDTIKKIMPK